MAVSLRLYERGVLLKNRIDHSGKDNGSLFNNNNSTITRSNVNYIYCRNNSGGNSRVDISDDAGGDSSEDGSGSSAVDSRNDNDGNSGIDSRGNNGGNSNVDSRGNNGGDSSEDGSGSSAVDSRNDNDGKSGIDSRGNNGGNSNVDSRGNNGGNSSGGSSEDDSGSSSGGSSEDASGSSSVNNDDDGYAVAQIFPLPKFPDLQQVQDDDQWTPFPEKFNVVVGQTMTETSLSPHFDSPWLYCFNPSEKLQSLFDCRGRWARLYTPLPELPWGDASEVWQIMKMKDIAYVRDCNVLIRHPALHSGMRSILLDWLSEVCEVYRLHRDTYHLAIDLFDRFLGTQVNIDKDNIQLIGITALFISAKLEEVYPPRIKEFSYVTDGACSIKDICQQEVAILQSLKWDLSPVTSSSWLSLYVHLVNLKPSLIGVKETDLNDPNYTGHISVQFSRLIDLCLMDIGSLQFSYGQLAAAVLYHFTDDCAACKVSGYLWEEISPCVKWMAPFAVTVRESCPVHMKTFQDIPYSDSHNIQTHAADLALLEKARDNQRQMRKSNPLQASTSSNVMTPPASARKPAILRG